MKLQSFSCGERENEWTGWSPKTDVQDTEFKKEVMGNRGLEVEEDLGTIQKQY